MSIKRRDVFILLATNLGGWIFGAQKALAQSFPRIDFPGEPVDPRFPPRDPHLFLIKGLGFICIEPSFIPTRLRFSISRSFDIPLNVRVETSSPAFVISSGNTFTIPARATVFEVPLVTSGLERGGRSIRSGNLRILVSSDRLTVEKRVDIFVKQVRGEWKDGGVIELVGIHAAMMPNGQVLFFSYNSRGKHYDEEGQYQLWDPETRRFNGSSIKLSNWNPFCAGHSFLGDGRLFVAGGYKSGDAARNSAADKVRTVGISTEAGRPTVRWDESFAKMEDKRWYPTCVTLADGNSLIIGGSAPSIFSDWTDTNEDIEFFDIRQNRLIQKSETRRDYPRDDRFQRPSGDRRNIIEDGRRLAGLYSLCHLLPNIFGDDAPNGLLFVLTEMFARVYNPDTNRIIGTKIDAGGFRTWWTQGSSVLLPIDVDFEGNGSSQVRIVVFGGGSIGSNDRNQAAISSATVFLYEVATRNLRIEGTIPLRKPRFMGDSILLPDGNIFIVGGASRGYANENSDGITAAELLTPTTGSSLGASRTLASSRITRGYHASAVLSPDGSVVVSGGTCGWRSGVTSEPTCEQFSVEVFEPPYFSCGPRPIIVSAPDRLSYGESFEVESQSSGVREQIILIRCGSRTHSLDTDQRMLRLQARRRSDLPWILQARMPSNRTYAPPGPYMMFLLRGDEHGVPSRAKFVQVN